MSEMDLNWSGVLTAENAEQVKELLRQFLIEKRFTLLVAKDPQHSVEVTDDLELLHWVNNPILVHEGSNGSVCISLSSGMTYYLEYKDKPFLSFNQNHGVLSICQTDYNHRLYWVFFLERD